MQARTHKVSPVPLLFPLPLTRFSFPLVCRPLSTQGLYCDIRQLVQFIKEAHGNVFRRVALSALLDSAEKITTAKKTDEKEEAKQSGGRRYACWSISPSELLFSSLLPISFLLFPFFCPVRIYGLS